VALAAQDAVKLLSADVDAATGARKADLLAHIGYAYFRWAQVNGGEPGEQSASFFREALAADPQNPYAHEFSGELVLSKTGSIAEVKQHFSAALASHREPELVRQLEFSALARRGTEEADDLFWQLVNGMRKAGEPLSPSVTESMITSYTFSFKDEHDRKRLYAAVPPADHVELTRIVLRSDDTGGKLVPVKVMLAYSLEAAGRKDEALAAWQDVLGTVQGYKMDTYNTMIQEALTRLGAPKAH
jgi:tetratricopeptide (TPR) repeat protein